MFLWLLSTNLVLCFEFFELKLLTNRFSNLIFGRKGKSTKIIHRVCTSFEH